MPARDLTGLFFDRVTVVRRILPNRMRSVWWECLCRCGKTFEATSSNLVSGRTRSCGCLNRENLAKRIASAVSYTSEYRIHAGILQRCYNPQESSYARYGGRGIDVCSEWRGREGFRQFLQDVGPRPSPDHTIEREDNDGPYSKDNCRWILRREQSRNRRNNRYVIYLGRTQCLAAWAEELNLSYPMVVRRLQLGWTVEEALSFPKGTRRR